MIHRNIILALIAFTFIVLFSTPFVAAQDTAPPAVGLRPDAPAYALHGPYWVGARDYLVPEGDSQFGITVWYPALNADLKPENITYYVSKELLVQLGLPEDAKFPITGHALANAAPDLKDGPYPLVVFSPGLTTMRQSSTYLFEHLASMGFVVISMDHRGEDYTNYWEAAYYRPAETRLTIQFADDLTAQGDLKGMINVDKLAVLGGSSGGWTALVGGGAQMNLGGCPIQPDPTQGLVWYYDCLQFRPHQDEIATLFGMSATPEQLWPQYYDARVDAVISFAPDGDIWGSEYQGVASVTVPTMVVASSKDTANIPDRASYPIYAHLGSAVKLLVVFENADHPIFTDTCAVMPWMVEDFGNFWVCSDPVWDKERAQDLINHLTTAFLLDVLKGDTEAHAALAPAAVSFNGITYEAQGY